MTNFLAVQYVNCGVEHFRANQFERALAMFDAALQYDPEYSYALYNRATALLSLGDYERGFREYEATWRLFHWRGFGPVRDDIDRLQALPMWRGEQGRLLLYHEMGFGDAIMAMRYLPELRQRAELTLVIDPCLSRLARRFDIAVVESVPPDLTTFDYRLPFFGVMGVLGTIPNAPYISGGVWEIVHKRPRVGIAWSGRTQTMFSLNDFLSRLTLDGFELYALQPGTATGEVVSLPPGGDFADVADRIAQMDHVICVDTAAIHLAGAMGHPSAHLVLPHQMDWRWWHAERWYPRIKTYRQAGHDWALPFNRINETLSTERKKLKEGELTN